jgi:hypothetical protein
LTRAWFDCGANNLQECCLTRAGRANDGNLLAGLYREVQVTDGRDSIPLGCGMMSCYLMESDTHL